MASFDVNKYQPTIDAILRTVNLDEITAKRLRRGLEGVFSVDLSNHKREIDEVIMTRYMVVQEEVNGKKEDPTVHEKSDALLAAKLQSSWNRRELRNEPKPQRSSVPKKRKTAASSSSSNTPPKKKSNPNNPFNRPYMLSPDLQQLVGQQQLSRPQCVKQLWVYIKEHNLQNPDNKREILSDEAFARVFGPKIDCFTMNKVLKDHMAKPEELREVAETAKDDVLANELENAIADEHLNRNTNQSESSEEE